jgi:hypothetical protein
MKWPKIILKESSAVLIPEANPIDETFRNKQASLFVYFLQPQFTIVPNKL